MSAVALALVGIGVGAGPTSASAPPRGPLVLTARAIDGIDIGLAEPVALDRLRAVLGPRGRVEREAANRNCGYDAIAIWPVLTAFFFHERLVGYAYGPTHARAVPPAVATGGLRLGETTAQLRHLYGRRLRLSGEQGGAYFVTTREGRIDGFLTDEIQRADARVASIDSGNVGCPAMSP